MKTVILAGGYGTRLSEETSRRPKPMVEIGGKPILWHIMKTYSHYGYNDFIILLGYRGYVIKEYFANYFLYQSDVTIDLANNTMEVHNNNSEPWKVTLVDTGHDTRTGGRIHRARTYIGEKTFMLTYGDGVTNANIDDLVRFHKSHYGTVTMTAVQPEGKYGKVFLDDGNTEVRQFNEKPKGDGEDNWINGGFFVCDPDVFDYLEGDEMLESGPMQRLSNDGKLHAFKHDGFWRCMDTLRDKGDLNAMWEKGSADWKVW